ncbi:Uncharacterized protein PECH_003739 [Penicillium ucsense]|uniref:Uncharacterized protein n=1 Tax=Penicillium ucsense TaxID=2839758 RepID=A0A8J8WD43_9EURO|nr:Uncharacterized protein PECM_003131 [Penicillium ucsense]KAF7729200.1 Uncharacterized protein PECH_003739 [Penicillium ucsense]
MQSTTPRSGSTTPLGRDPDIQWLQLLAHTKCKTPASLSSGPAIPSPSSPTPLQSAATGTGTNLNKNHSGRAHSCSSATSYFTLLSVTGDAQHLQHGDGRQRAARGQQYAGSVTPPGRHMDDSSWIAWFSARGGSRAPMHQPEPQHKHGHGHGHGQHQHGQTGDSTSRIHDAGPSGNSDQSYFPSKPPVQLPVQSQPQSQSQGPSQDQTTLPDRTIVPGGPSLGTSAFTGTGTSTGTSTTTSTTRDTTPPFSISSTATASGPGTSFPSPLAPLTDAEIDAMIQQFPTDSTDGFSWAFSDPSTYDAGLFDLAETDSGLASWLNEQHAFALHLGGSTAGAGTGAEAGAGAASFSGPMSPGKRSLTLDGYPGEMSAEQGMGWDAGIGMGVGSKRLKV